MIFRFSQIFRGDDVYVIASSLEEAAAKFTRSYPGKKAKVVELLAYEGQVIQ